jgi:hypothetical protein
MIVDAYMEELVHPQKAAIQELRTFVLSVDPRIRERVKWRAPSFYLADDFATMRIHPAPILQLVLHAGSKKHTLRKSFTVPDPQGLLKWPAADRCVLTFASPGDIGRLKAPLKAILLAWIQQL